MSVSFIVACLELSELETQSRWLLMLARAWMKESELPQELSWSAQVKV
jgi:hypothetical protein